MHPESIDVRPMSEKQETYLRHLCEQHDEEFDPDLSMTEAWARIQELIRKSQPRAAEVRQFGPCPQCNAPAGRSCVRASGMPRKANHKARVDAARVLKNARGRA
jgi:hypothetical protein